MKKLLSVLCALTLSLFCVEAYAQMVVRGVIKDESGAGIPGAAVVISGTLEGVTADYDGNYMIEVQKGKTLEFSFLGMITEKVVVGNSTTINVVLHEDSMALDEVVVVGMGSQNRGSITNAVSIVKGAELLKAPVVGLNNVVGTRVAGVVALQQSGQPGADAASILVRGQSAVCIVDGVPRDINELDPNEVESVSVLKDATSASIYGLNCNAVILVTTKKGDASKTRISYSGEYGVSQNTNMIQLLNGPQYAYWYNKALELDCQAMGTAFTPVFTSQHVQYMQNGEKGWGNTDWYGKTFGTGISQHHNISATGGNENVKFFTSIGYYDQDGNVENFTFNRYNLRSNIEAKIARDLTFELGISGRVETRHQPGFSANPDDWSNIPQQAVRALPYVPETYEIDGVTYPVSTRTASSWVNPIAAAEETGFYESRNTYMQTNMSLRYDVHQVKGLYFKLFGSYDLTYQNTRRVATPYYTAVLTLPTAGVDELSYVRSTDARGTSVSITEGAAYSYNTVGQASVNFDREFGAHKVKVLGLAEARENFSRAIGATGYGLNFNQMAELNFVTNKTGDGSDKQPSVSGYAGNTRVAGFVGRVNYEYDNRYLVEASVRYDGSYVFSNKAGSRWITLPGVSVGWKINNEDWFTASWVNSLKLRASVGKTANSNIAAYQYMNLMALNKNQVVIGNGSANFVSSSTLGNPDLTWASVNNYNVGFDFDAWNGLFGAEVDVFYKFEYNILSSVTGSYAPSTGGYHMTYGNENKKDYRGFDLTLRHNNYIGSFNYGAKLVLSYAYRRWLYYAGDSDNTPDYLKLTGKEVGAQEGFIALGLFQSDEEAASSATIEGSKVAAGYIKYLDRNGDGKISYEQDRGYVGANAYPKIQGSINLFANWKGFDLDMLWQGAAGRSVSLTGIYTSNWVMDNTFLTKPFYHGGNSPLYLLERAWTPENPNGEFPRPSITPLSSNNAYSSTFWYRDGTYLRLKSLQIGYTFPQKWTKHVGVSSLRLYLQGANLLTFSELTKYGIDPEQPGVNNGYYPQQKTYQLGAKITF